jgi:hypothetical protein
MGREEYQRYKNKLVGTTVILDEDENEKIKAEFQLQWQDECNKIQEKLTKSTLLAASELIRMLQEAISALQVQEVKPKVISGKFASYSLSYQRSGQRERVGIVWTEDASMQSFYAVMNACKKVVNSNLCQTLYLIRAAGVGNSKLAGNKIYKQIFTGSQHHHITPTLSSVHYLATYHSFVNAVLANELVVAGKTLSLKELEALVREAEILHECTLLQDLEIVPKKNGGGNGKIKKLQKVKQFLLNVVITQQFMGLQALVEKTEREFSEVDESQIEQLIQQLCEENKIQILDPGAKKEAQFVFLVTKS